jgi:hypothetical protein
MGYMKRWLGKTEAEDESGHADYMVEGELFSIPLPSFAHAQTLDRLLDTAFQQGKQFAFQGVQRMVEQAMVEADRRHALTMTRKTPNVGSEAGPTA